MLKLLLIVIRSQAFVHHMIKAISLLDRKMEQSYALTYPISMKNKGNKVIA